MTSARRKPARRAPHAYQTKQPVDVTWRAMHLVRQQWHCAGCQLLLRGKK